MTGCRCEVASAAAAAGRGRQQRVLAMSLAGVVAAVAVRDFPQRWPGFVDELFGICDGVGEEGGGGMAVGCKIVLECLTVLTEDCTDSDFNAKISSTRRNDVLTGLNEVASSNILPQLYSLFSHQYGTLSTALVTLKQMTAYTATHTLTPEEQTQFRHQKTIVETSSQIVRDCLRTLYQFCKSMPLEWIFPTVTTTTTTSTAATSSSSSNDPSTTTPAPPPVPPPPFLPALFHLLRESTDGINTAAVHCLSALAARKLDYASWWHFVEGLPSAVREANAALAKRKEEEQQQRRGFLEGLAKELDFHRGVSRCLADAFAGHLVHVVAEPGMLQKGNPKNETLLFLLTVATEMLSHPSGRIHSEQINAWIQLCREPQIVESGILAPFIPDIFASYKEKLVRLRWEEDVEEGQHPLAVILEASWDDGDEYEIWLNELKSKSTQLYRLLSHTSPSLVASATEHHLRQLIDTHGGVGRSTPADHPDEVGRWTTESKDNIMLESGQGVLENVLLGLPVWSLKGEVCGSAEKEMNRCAVRTCFSSLSSHIISWTPTDPLLQHRRTIFLESLKHYWKHDPTTLLPGYEALMSYIQPPSSPVPMPDTESLNTRKRAGFALVSVAKVIPHLLLPHLDALSARAGVLLSSGCLLPGNEMNLYKVLTCVSAAITDPVRRRTFVAEVLEGAFTSLDTDGVKRTVATGEELLSAMGVTRAREDPTGVTNPAKVEEAIRRYTAVFSPLNRVLSVGKRCHSAAQSRTGGVPILPPAAVPPGPPPSHPPDEGSLPLETLSLSDPFTPLWPRVTPVLLPLLSSLLSLCAPSTLAALWSHPVMRYALAATDDEAYLARKKDSKGGVFGEGGTAGSVLRGWNRKDTNLAAKWGAWMNELHMMCFQLLGLGCEQRAWYAGEMGGEFARLVAILVDEGNLGGMEHRFLAPFLKQFIEPLILTCPTPLYQTHLSPILTPLLSHIPHRLSHTWSPLLSSNSSPRPFSTADISSAATLAAAATGNDAAAKQRLLEVCYARGGGLFVGDLEDDAIKEGRVEKGRVDLTRAFADMIQVALALKGDWALVLANQAKQEQAQRKNDPSLLATGPRTKLSSDGDDGAPVNADGTPRKRNHEDMETRKWLRIYAMGRFLLLDDGRVPVSLITAMTECLKYPDQYTCRRICRIGHRIIETCVSHPRYSPLLSSLFSAAVASLVMEPKWMVGVEWDVIALVRDAYCRMVLGQTLLPGGQGPGVPLARVEGGGEGMTGIGSGVVYEQSKMVDDPIRGGGVLCRPSDLPRNVLASLPGVGMQGVIELENTMIENRAVKNQKDKLRDLLRVAAEQVKLSEQQNVGNGDSQSDSNNPLGRAGGDESLLNSTSRPLAVPSLPEKLVTVRQVNKQMAKEHRDAAASDVLTGGAGLSSVF